MIDYGLLVSVLAFFAAVQLTVRYNMSPMFGSFVAVGVPYIVSLILRLVYAVGYGLPILENLFSVRSVIVLLIQFVISFAVFKKLQNEEGYGALIGWGVIGAIVVIFVVPFAVTYAISL